MNDRGIRWIKCLSLLDGGQESGRALISVSLRRHREGRRYGSVAITQIGAIDGSCQVDCRRLFIAAR